MKQSGRIAPWLTAFLACVSSLSATTLTFEANVSGPGGPFDGRARFHFALVDQNARVLWTTGSPEHMASKPVELVVRNGRVAAMLGDTAVGFPAIGPEVGAQPGTRLRIWMQAPNQGWVRLGGEEPVPVARDAQPLTAAQGAEIMRELRELRALVNRAPQPARPAAAPQAPLVVQVPLVDAPSLGSEIAEWVLIEFTDFQCPFCRRFSEEVLPTLRERLIDTGRVRFIARELPLAMHALAAPAAKVALLAHRKGRYWDLRGPLFANNGSLTEARILELATQAGVDASEAESAMASQEFQALVDTDIAAARNASITGTPSFVFGRVENGVVSGVRIIGAGSAPAFLNQLENEMAAAAARAKQPGGAS